MLIYPEFTWQLWTDTDVAVHTGAEEIQEAGLCSTEVSRKCVFGGCLQSDSLEAQDEGDLQRQFQGREASTGSVCEAAGAVAPEKAI